MLGIHSVAFEQYKFGAIRKERIQGHPNQRLPTRTMGAERDALPETTIAGTRAGDPRHDPGSGGGPVQAAAIRSSSRRTPAGRSQP